MIASLRAASAAGPSIASPALSGPRWASVSRIASTSARSGETPSSRTSPQIPHTGPALPYALSASRSSRAARSGSAASPIARTTAMRVAPAATTSATFDASMPPIANQGWRAWAAA